MLTGGHVAVKPSRSWSRPARQTSHDKWISELCSLVTVGIWLYVKEEKYISYIGGLEKNAVISVGGEAWWVCLKTNK